MISEKNLSMLINIAHMARKHQNFSFSERIFQHLNHAYPLRAFPHTGLALVYFDQGNYLRASCEFEKSMELGERSKHLYLPYSVCQFFCGRYKKGAEALHKAVELDKKDGCSDMYEAAKTILDNPDILKLFHEAANHSPDKFHQG